MIRFENIYKSFGKRAILKGINFDLPKGKTTVILGVSGGGKSTIIKHIVGLLTPDSGSIYINDKKLDVSDEESLLAIRKKVGFLFQHGALFDSMNVFDNVAFGVREHQNLSQEKIKRIVEAKLTMVGLDTEVVSPLFPDELSGGMRKRVGLARTLALEPEAILYDEPTSGLDPISSDFITKMIVDVQQNLGVTSVLISHDIKEAFKAGDYFLMLHEGVIVEAGDATHFKASSHRAVQEFLGEY